MEPKKKTAPPSLSLILHPSSKTGLPYGKRIIPTLVVEPTPQPGPLKDSARIVPAFDLKSLSSGDKNGPSSQRKPDLKSPSLEGLYCMPFSAGSGASSWTKTNDASQTEEKKLNEDTKESLCKSQERSVRRQIKCLQLQQEERQGQQKRQLPRSYEPPPPPLPSSKIGLPYGKRKIPSPLVAEPSPQTKPLKDSARIVPAFDLKSLSSGDKDGPSSQRQPDLKSPSLEGLYCMPFSAGYDTSSWTKSNDAPQTEEKKLNEDIKESLYKKQERSVRRQIKLLQLQLQQQQRELQLLQQQQLQGQQQRQLPRSHKPPPPPSSKMGLPYGKRKIPSPLVAEPSPQTKPLKDSARIVPAFDLKSLSSSDKDGPSSQRQPDFKSPSLEGLYCMPFSAGYDTSSWTKSNDAPQTEEKKLNEDIKESLYKKRERSVRRQIKLLQLQLQQQQRELQLLQQQQLQGQQQRQLPRSHKPPFPPSSKMGLPYGKRKIPTPLVAEPSPQPEPVKDSAPIAPTFDHNFRHPSQAVHKMSGRGHFSGGPSSQRQLDLISPFLEGLYPSMWTPFFAGSGASSWTKTNDASQTEEKKLNEDTKESLCKSQERSVRRQIKCLQLQQEERQGQQKRQLSRSHEPPPPPPPPPPSSKIGLPYGKRKIPSPLVAEPSPQTKPLKDSAQIVPAFDLKSLSTGDKDGPSSQRHPDLKSPSLERLYCMPFSAGYDTSSWTKSNDAPQTEEKKLNEDIKESLYKKQERSVRRQIKLLQLQLQQQQRELQLLQQQQLQGQQQRQLPRSHKPPPPPSSKMGLPYGKRKIPSPLVAEPSPQTKPLKDSARIVPAFDLKSLSSGVKDGPSSQRQPDLKSPPLEGLYCMPFSAGYDTSSWTKSNDAPQTEEKKLNEDIKESLYKKQERSVRRQIKLLQLQLQQQQRELQLLQQQQLQGQQQRQLPRSHKPPSPPSSEIGLPYGKRKIPTPLVAEPSPQPEPVKDSAPIAPTFDHNVRHPYQAVHKMSGRGHFSGGPSSQRQLDLISPSLEGLYPSMWTPFFAGSSNWTKTNDASQTEEKKLNEDTKESLCKSQERSVRRQIKCLQLQQEERQGQQKRQLSRSHEPPPPPLPSSKIGLPYGKRKIPSPLVAEPSPQTKPLKNSAQIVPAFDLKSLSTGDKDGPSSQRQPDLKSPSLEGLYWPMCMPFSAGYDTSSWTKSNDAPQTEEKKLNEDTKESYKNQERSVKHQIKLLQLQQQQRELQLLQQQQLQGQQQRQLPRSHKPPSPPSSEIGLPYGKRKIPTPLVAEPSPQPEPVKDSAPIATTFDHNVRHPYQAVHKMSGRGHFSGGPSSQRQLDLISPSLEGLYPSMWTPFFAGSGASSWTKTNDASQTEEKKLNEDTKESLCKSQERSVRRQIKCLQLQQEERQGQQKRQLSRSHKPPPPPPPSSEIGLPYGKRKIPTLLVAEPSPQPEPVKDSAPIAPTFDHNVRHPYQAVHEMSGRGHFSGGPSSQRQLDRISPSLEGLYPSMWTPFFAGSGTSSWTKTNDASQTEEKKLNEDTKESLCKSQERSVRRQIKCLQLQQEERQGQQKRQLSRSHKPPPPPPPSSEIGLPYGKRKIPTLLVAEPSPQPEPVKDSAPIAPTFDHNVRHPYQVVHEMSGRGYFSGGPSSQRQLDLISPSLEGHYPSMWTPFSAGSCTSSWRKTNDASQTEEQKLNEDTNESLCRNQKRLVWRNFQQQQLLEVLPAECYTSSFKKTHDAPQVEDEYTGESLRKNQENLITADDPFYRSSPVKTMYLVHPQTVKIPFADPQSTAPTVAGPPSPQGRPSGLLYSTVCTEGNRGQDAFEMLSDLSAVESGGDSNVLMETEALVTAVNYSVTNTQPTHFHLQTSSDPGWSRRASRCLPHSHSVPLLSQITSAENKSLTRSKSLPDIIPLRNSFEEFTPDITADEHDDTFRFQCSSPGLYQCSVTGLLFHMEGEGDVVYRIVPWNRRLLAQHHKRPAGPLFDITCLQQSVCQLHLPHCEIHSTGGGEFLSVAHLSDEDIEFIAPHEITETHVIINITGFSAFGNVKDEDSPPDPVRALVLLFYRPPADPKPKSVLNVLLLPRNVVLRDVVRNRKKLVGDENYIELSPHCKLSPKQEYTLSTCPEDDSVLVQPTEAEFDSDNYDDYFPSFQVELEKIMEYIKLLLRDTNKQSVWERRVCLWSTAVKRSCGSSALNLPPHEKLSDIRSSFIERISGPVLKSLLDKLFEKKVMTDAERESADEMQNQRDKARFVIDTVRRKGEAASSEIIEFLCEADPFLCEHLRLI